MTLRHAELALVIVLIAVVVSVVISAFMPFDRQKLTVYYVSEPDTATKRIPRGFHYIKADICSGNTCTMQLPKVEDDPVLKPWDIQCVDKRGGHWCEDYWEPKNDLRYHSFFGSKLPPL